MSRFPAAIIASAVLLATFAPTRAVRADALIERFARLEAIGSASVAPDGRHVALLCERNGRRAACVYEIDAVDAPPLVFEARPGQRLSSLSWTAPDWLIFSVDLSQDLTNLTRNVRLTTFSRLVAVNIRTREGAQLMTNAETSWTTDVTEVAAAPPATPDEVLMTAVYADGRVGVGYGLYKVNLRTGLGKRVDDGGNSTYKFVLAPDGTLVARADFVGARRTDSIYRIDGRGATRIFERTGVDTSVYAIAGLLADNRRLALGKVSPEGRYRPWSIDLSNGDVQPIDIGLPDIDVQGWMSEGGSPSIVGVTYVDDVPRQKFLEPTLQRALATLEKALPGQGVFLQSWSADRKIIAAAAALPGEPATYYLYDVGRKSVSPIGPARPELAGLPMSTTTRIPYAARDGLGIEAFLTLPPGKTAKDGPFPLLLFPHGGPLERSDARFDWWGAYFAQRGYAVLKPNFRGSDGYGLEFRKRGYGEFGGAMIDDIIDGARHLVAQGTADGGRICAMGASYGGYASLMVAIRDPALVKCVVAVNAFSEPSDLMSEVVKHTGGKSLAVDFWEDYMGSRFRDQASKIAISPARSAQAIKVPVLLLHGALDSTVFVEQSRTLARKMQAAGGRVRLVEFPGDDHYLRTSEVRRVMLSEIETFLTTGLPDK